MLVKTIEDIRFVYDVFYYHCSKDEWFLSNVSFNDEFKGF